MKYTKMYWEKAFKNGLIDGRDLGLIESCDNIIYYSKNLKYGLICQLDPKVKLTCKSIIEANLQNLVIALNSDKPIIVEYAQYTRNYLQHSGYYEKDISK